MSSVRARRAVSDGRQRVARAMDLVGLIALIADGAYASLLRYDLPRAVVISRLRRDAALNDLAPPRTGRPGRPRTRGDRLPKPPELAKQVTNWTSVKVCVRGQMIERQLWSRTLLWYETARSRPLLLVIVRDPCPVSPSAVSSFRVGSSRRQDERRGRARRCDAPRSCSAPSSAPLFA